jgi:hypothetical protein
MVELRKTTENFNKDSWSLAQEQDLGLSRYETGVVSIRLHYLALIYLSLTNDMKLKNRAAVK